jgi:hypothetical protein
MAPGASAAIQHPNAAMQHAEPICHVPCNTQVATVHHCCRVSVLSSQLLRHTQYPLGVLRTYNIAPSAAVLTPFSRTFDVATQVYMLQRRFICCNAGLYVATQVYMLHASWRLVPERECLGRESVRPLCGSMRRAPSQVCLQDALRRTNAQRRFSLLSGSGYMGVSVAVGHNAAPPLSPPQRIDYSERVRFGIAVANRMPSAGERLQRSYMRVICSVAAGQARGALTSLIA